MNDNESPEKQKREKLRNDNTVNLKRPSSKELSKLISNMKQCAAFPKKLLNLNANNYDQILKDFTQLNLTRYIEETVQYLCSDSNKIEENDLPLLIEICSLIHQRYVEFSELIPTKLSEVLLSQTKSLALDKRDALFPHQRRNFHLLTEFFIVGIFDDWNVIYECIKNIIKNDTIKSDGSLHSLMLMGHFSKLGAEEILGVRKDDKQEPENPLVTPQNQKKMKSLIVKYFDFVSTFLMKEYRSLKGKEKDLKEQLQTKGVLHSKVQENYKERQVKFENLLNAINSLAEPLQLEIPKMVEEKPPEDPKLSVSVNLALNNEELGIWDDKETQDFYENLPDLTTLIPLVLLGLDQSNNSTANIIKPKNTTPNKPNDSKETQQQQQGEEGKEKKSKLDEIKVDQVSMTDLEEQSEKKEEIEDVKSSMGETFISLVSLLNNLPNCNSREAIDKATIDFCYVNTKKSRKNLIEELYRVPKNKLELIPYYSRMVATLTQYFPKLAERLLLRLINEFYYLIKLTEVSPSPFIYERKNKNIKFLSELTKFKVCPIEKTFYFFQLCFENYSLANMEMLCMFLDNCGRFLFKTNDTHIRTKLVLETLFRLKQVHNIKGTLEIMIDNAYFQCNPPTTSIKTKQRTPVQLYIRHLLYKQIQPSTVSHIVTQLRKLNWKEESAYLMKCLYKVGKLKFNQIPLVAQIITLLSPYHPTECIRLMDQLLENLQLFLENSDKQNNQQAQLMNIKLIAHLFLYHFFTSSLLFSVLYAIIEFGVDNVYSTHDSFRVRMVCVLLEIVAPSLNTNSLKKILNLYLLYFQRYVLSLKHISLDLQFQVHDLFSLLEKHKLLTFKPFTSLTLLSEYLQTQLNELFPNSTHLSNSTLSNKNKKDTEEPLTIPVTSVSLPNLPQNSKEETQELTEEELEKLEIEKKEEELRQKKLQEIEEKKKKEEYERQQKELFENEFRLMISSSLEERKKQEFAKPGMKERSLMIPLSLLKDLEEERLNAPSSTSPSDTKSSSNDSNSFSFPPLKSKKGSSDKKPEVTVAQDNDEEEQSDEDEDLSNDSEEDTNEDEPRISRKKPAPKKAPLKVFPSPTKAQKFRLLVRPNRGTQKTQAKPLFIPNDSELVIKHNLQKQAQLDEKNELALLVIASANRLGQDEDTLDYSYHNPSKPQKKKNFYEDYDPNEYTNSDN